MCVCRNAARYRRAFVASAAEERRKVWQGVHVGGEAKDSRSPQGVVGADRRYWWGTMLLAASVVFSILVGFVVVVDEEHHHHDCRGLWTIKKKTMADFFLCGKIHVEKETLLCDPQVILVNPWYISTPYSCRKVYVDWGPEQMG